MNIQDGTYAARPKACSVTRSRNGHLMAAIKLQLENGPELTFYSVIVKEDGTVNTRNIDDIREWSGWDGIDPFWLMEADLTQFAVEVVIANEPSIVDPSRLWPAVKWVNPPGGGGGNALPKPADRREVMALYGAKLRALAGGTPMAAPVRGAGGGEAGGVAGGFRGAGVADRAAKVARDVGPSAALPRDDATARLASPAPSGGQADLTCDFAAGNPVRNPGGHRGGYATSTGGGGNDPMPGAGSGAESARRLAQSTGGMPPVPVRRAAPVAAHVAARVATQASAWSLLNEKAGPMPRAQVEELWFGFVDATGMDQVDMTPEGWAAVEAAVAAHFGQGANEPMPF